MNWGTTVASVFAGICLTLAIGMYLYYQTTKKPVPEQVRFLAPMIFLAGLVAMIFIPQIGIFAVFLLVILVPNVVRNLNQRRKETRQEKSTDNE